MTPQEHYDAMVAAGESPVIAEMLALRRPPGTKATDRTLLQGWMHTDQFDAGPIMRARGRKYRKLYKDVTGSYPVGKRYIHGLAQFPGDPRAWIDSVSDMKRVVQEAGNLNAEGIISHTADIPDESYAKAEKPYEVAEHLVNERMAAKLALDPDLRHAKPEKLKEVRHTLKKKMSGAQ